MWPICIYVCLSFADIYFVCVVLGAGGGDMNL